MAKTPKTPKTSKIQVAGRLVVLAGLCVMGAAAMSMHQQLFLLCVRKAPPTPPLPYDAEVEYVAIGGGQICNLGIQPTVETVFKVRASFQTQDGELHFGIIVSEYTNFRIFHFYGRLYFDLGNYYGQGGRCIVSDFPIKTVKDLEFGNNYIKVDGVEVVRKTTSTTTLSQSDFLLGGGGASNVYSAQLSTGGVLQRDLIPVRLGTVGYFYDRVSGGMFGASTGSLTPGPDKS